MDAEKRAVECMEALFGRWVESSLVDRDRYRVVLAALREAHKAGMEEAAEIAGRLAAEARELVDELFEAGIAPLDKTAATLAQAYEYAASAIRAKAGEK